MGTNKIPKAMNALVVARLAARQRLGYYLVVPTTHSPVSGWSFRVSQCMVRFALGEELTVCERAEVLGIFL